MTDAYLFQYSGSASFLSGMNPEYVALGEVGDLSCLNCDRMQELLQIVVLFGVLVLG